MKNFARCLAVAAFAAVLVFVAGADEGMWMPHQMIGLNLKSLGLQMDPGDLYKKDGTGLMSAIVNLGGGTGEFVSPEGLVLTNHHVAYGAIQRASSKEKDYIADGFLARTRGEEIQAQGYQVGVLLGYEDVTAKVNSYFKPKMTPRERYDAFDKAQKDLIAAGEKAGPDLRCTLASMYSGNAYYLYTFKQIRDVRLVYAPPQDLGNFGGETDNWMWPRHTCDFSFLRAYVAPDGTAADFSPSNVPYKPKAWLKVSLDGFKEGDFTFVMGYPGRTYRNYALAELRADQENMARRIKDTQDLIGFYEAAGKADKEVEIRYAGQVKGLYNGLKNRQGKIEGFLKYDLVSKKAAQEQELVDWIAADPARAKKYGAAPAALDGLPGPAESLRREVGAPQRGPRRLDRSEPGLRDRPGRARAPKTRQGQGTSLSGTERSPAQAGHSAGRAGLRLRHGPGAPEVDAQAPQGRASRTRPRGPPPSRAWPQARRPRSRRGSMRCTPRHRSAIPPRGSSSSASSPPRSRRSTIPSSSSPAAMEQELKVIREESKGMGQRRRGPQDGPTKRPSWR